MPEIKVKFFNDAVNDEPLVGMATVYAISDDGVPFKFQVGTDREVTVSGNPTIVSYADWLAAGGDIGE